MNNTSVIYRYILKVLIFLIMASSLLTYKSLMGGVTSAKKMGFVVAVSMALLVSMFFVLLSREKLVFKWNVFDTILSVYLIYNVFSHVVIANHHILDQNFLCFISCIALYFFVRLLYEKGDVMKPLDNNLIWSILLVSAIQVIVGLLQFYGIMPSLNRYFRVTGLFGNPARLGMFLAAIFPLALGIFLFYNSEKGNIFLYYLSLFTGIGVLLLLPGLHSRTTIVAILTGSFMVLNYKYGWGAFLSLCLKKVLVKVVFCCLLIAVIGLLLFGLYVLKPESAFGRLFVWEVSFDMIKDAPLFGLGYDSFQDLFNNYQSEWFKANTSNLSFDKKVQVAGKVSKAYNELVQLLVEKGVFGLLIVFSFVYCMYDKRFVKSKYKGEEDLFWKELILIASLIAISTTGCFGYPFSIIPVNIVLMLLLGMLCSMRKTNFNVVCRRSFLNKKKIPLYRVLAFCSIFTSIGVIFYQLKLVEHYKNWKIAAVQTKSGLYRPSLEYYEKAYKYLKYDGNFLHYYGNALYNTNAIDESITVLEQAKNSNSDIYLYTLLGQCYQEKKNYRLAYENYRHAIYMIPSMFYPKYLLAKSYKENGETTKAKDLAAEILSMKVKVNSKAVEQIKDEMTKLIKNKT